MGKRSKQDEKLKEKRTRDDMKVLTHVMKKSTLKRGATGKLESPQKVVIFYAGYIAMRRLWEAKTKPKKGKKRLKTGDPELDADKGVPEFINRIDKEIAHPLGIPTNTLLKVAKFKYWGKKILAMCENMDQQQ